MLLNGPPGCGKDTLAEEMVPSGFTPMSFKPALYQAVSDHYGIPLEEVLHWCATRELKDEVWNPIGKTPREMMIEVSEEVYKPRFGKDYFGKAAAVACVEAGADFAVFSDGGFPEEIGPLALYYNQVIVVQLFREGFSFEKDSRTYVEGPDGTYQLTLVEGQVAEALGQLLGIAGRHK
ncbi:hypothetical protein [Kineobactrum salinum]|uniref:AAA family ATPase n=1 Tax=Kineobactrum salinum TaxID=2708301 RepID=A0A6C0UB44_9GAMM|nr:hypothetical protein [Kineobactrum salinum]QIB67194.1 hypothetical protein G3T16_19060 [Kineobactrum salinum]